jgi:hypothetical protein
MKSDAETRVWRFRLRRHDDHLDLEASRSAASRARTRLCRGNAVPCDAIVPENFVALRRSATGIASVLSEVGSSSAKDCDPNWFLYPQ